MLYQGIIGGGSSPVEPVDLSPVLLWTNSNPGATFAAQTVSLDLTEYAGVIIEFNRSSSSDAQTFANRSFIKKGETGLGGGNTVAVTPASRNVSCSNTGVIFEGGYSGTNPNDNAVIPTKIYGVKEYVVEPAVGDLLWTNSNPTAVLAHTEISGNYSKYKSILVKARANITVDFKSEFNIAKSSATYAGGICFTNLGVGDYYRNIQFTDEKIIIQGGHYMAGGTDTPADNAAIPLEIYGIE